MSSEDLAPAQPEQPQQPHIEAADQTVPLDTAQSAQPTQSGYGATDQPAPAWSAAAQSTAAPAADPLQQRTRPRSGPIVWGCLILVFCAYIAQRTFAPGTVDPAMWITGTLFGLGVLLLGVGAAIVVRNARDR